jgi:hypothetical protein
MNPVQTIRKRRHANFMERPVWCGICHIRVAPYETAVTVSHQLYHERCLDQLRHRRPAFDAPDARN